MRRGRAFCLICPSGAPRRTAPSNNSFPDKQIRYVQNGLWEVTSKCIPKAAALFASSSVVANPLIIFCRFTGGGVGGSEAGGVGGLLRLLCCRNQQSTNNISPSYRRQIMTVCLAPALKKEQILPCRSVGSNNPTLHPVWHCQRYRRGGSPR